MHPLIPILLFTFATGITPGPNNFMILNSGLQFGVKKSLPHYLGICFGFPVMVFTVALGFGIIFIEHIWLKQLLKIIGAAYMLYLAQHLFKTNNNSQSNQTAKPFNFLQALLFQWVNPKGWLMAIGAISLFSLTTNYFANAIAVSSIFLLICTPCIGVWLIFGAYMQKILKEEKHRRWFNSLMAFCLIVSIVMIFFE